MYSLPSGRTMMILGIIALILGLGLFSIIKPEVEFVPVTTTLAPPTQTARVELVVVTATPNPAPVSMPVPELAYFTSPTGDKFASMLLTIAPGEEVVVLQIQSNGADYFSMQGERPCDGRIGVEWSHPNGALKVYGATSIYMVAAKDAKLEECHWNQKIKVEQIETGRAELLYLDITVMVVKK